MGVPETTKEEFCPNCGYFVNRLVEYTGWCFPCSLPVILSIDENGQKTAQSLRCISCGGIIGDLTHKKCRTCRDSDWLLEHADEVDRCLAFGLSVYKAKKFIKAHSNPELHCLNCGETIKKATRGETLFCTKPECRSVYNKFRRLKYEGGLNREEALKTALKG